MSRLYKLAKEQKGYYDFIKVASEYIDTDKFSEIVKKASYQCYKNSDLTIESALELWKMAKTAKEKDAFELININVLVDNNCYPDLCKHAGVAKFLMKGAVHPAGLSGIGIAAGTAVSATQPKNSLEVGRKQTPLEQDGL